MDCIFCKIVAGQLPSTVVYQDEDIMAFRDINPAAPVHILLIPKVHIASANDITTENSAFVTKIFEIIPKIAESEGLCGNYRVLTNVGKGGGQEIFHLHFHLMGGLT